MEQIVVGAKIENLDPVLVFAARKLGAAGCPPKLQNQIILAVEEIFVNIANYAYSPETGKVTIRMSAGKGGEAVIVFEDSGKPYNPLEKDDPDITLSAEEREIGGLGVFMTKKLMDSVEYRWHGGRNILTLRKKFY